MNEPIKVGDVCLVTSGMGRHKSPNLGLTVRVVSLAGEHSKYGMVWRCEGPGVCQLTNGGEYEITGWADFPVPWLEKLPPFGAVDKIEKGAVA